MKDTDYKNYSNVSFIDKGGFGQVELVMNNQNQKLYAMKKTKGGLDEKHNCREIKFMKKLKKSAFVPKLYSSFEKYEGNDLFTFMCMQLMKQNLSKYLNDRSSDLTNEEFRFIFASIVLGLEDIHGQGIIHKDIKEKNVCIDENGYVYIIDFGVSKPIKNGKLTKGQDSGTFGYMAPEIINKTPFSYQSDFFSLGVMLHKVLLGYNPYTESNREDLISEMNRKGDIII